MRRRAAAPGREELILFDRFRTAPAIADERGECESPFVPLLLELVEQIDQLCKRDLAAAFRRQNG